MPHNTNVAFVTLGCAKNEVDSDKMKARLTAAGFSIVGDPALAALIVVNTCSFLMSAVDEGLEVIFDLVNQQAERPAKAKILVAGCMPARYGDDLESELTEVSGFLSAADEENIVEKAEELLGIDPSSLPAGLAAHGASIRSNEGPSAYVKISDGCDRFCSYCMIPYIRGRYHSFTQKQIFDEVAELVEGGVREIVFIGQDTGIWGRDLSPVQSTAELLDAAASAFPDTWFRLLYLQPAGINDELLSVMNAHDNICKYLDMPLQHADADVLKAMNREGSPAEYLQVLEHVRGMVPGITTRTTFMAGFPGETEEQFEELLDFAEEARFDYAVVFPYSQEDGSAAGSFDGQLDEGTKIERAQRLLDVCDVVGHASIARTVGKTVQALVEGYEHTDAGVEALARWQGQAPEVDGQIHVPIASEDALPIGSVVPVKITDSFYYELEGELA